MLLANEAKVLEQFQKRVREPITEEYDENFDYGYMVKDGHIICLKLTACRLQTLPEDLGELTYLKTLELQ